MFEDERFVDDQSRAARYSDLFATRRHEHTSDCAYCPMCATIAVVRKTRPEVLEHLSVAAREVLLAVGIMLEEASEILGGEKQQEEPEATADNVRRIDIG